VPRRKHPDTIVGRLKPADPFELIRWLARSQPDPRKALAELVQNSMDAGARKIRVTRLRDHGVTALHVLDDGEGVIPELTRTEALTYIATHVGYSRKRDLTPEQRRELMTQGKYGIGLLGFWAIGQVLEMRTQLLNEPPYVLRLFEDSPRFEIDRLRTRLAFGDRYTEIVVRSLHRPALVSLSARRICDYLAAELRGQLLARDVQILVHDRIARGLAPKVLEVRPVRFEGLRLPLTESIPVEGGAPLRIELYLKPEGGGATEGISILCAGSVVYDRIEAFEVADFRRAPWTDPRLTGIVDFAGFQVPPGSRRGVVPDQAALAFAAALRTVEPSIAACLDDAERRAAAEAGPELVRQLERAFRDLHRLAPEYDFFAVRGNGLGASTGTSPSAPGAGAGASPDLPGGAPAVSAAEDDEPPALLRPGPLAAVEIRPAATRVERLGERRLRAVALDASRIPIREGVDFRWRVEPALGTIEPQAAPAVVFRAGPERGTVTITASATTIDRSAAASSTVDIVEAMAGAAGPRTGVPEPTFVEESGASWRSRMREGRWEVNSGHADFIAASETSRRRFRYLATLLAKEIVVHSFPSPEIGPALERLVGVLAITERRVDRA
jgi:histidine kinase/DNA gyrase B/HSP90-like ATPase